MGALVPLAASTADDGAKAVNLRWLLEQGFAVPRGAVVGHGIGEHELARWLDPSLKYAVRSSASVEDSPSFSFAGQFATVLGARGAVEVTDAIRTVHESATAPRLLPYLQRAGVAADDVRMRVIVQEMVDARAAGVAFSRNPLTGLTDVVVESTTGSAEDLVAGRSTPQRWVWHWGEWIETPTDPDTPEPVLREVVTAVERVAAAFGTPVDIEWAWDGQKLWLLQVRPMTVLDVPVYSNRLSKEFLPGMIPPLVWSINVPVVNRAWLRLFSSLVGPLDLRPEDLARQFAYRAYFNMKAVGDIFEAMGMPRDLLEVLIGVAGGQDRPSFRPGRSAARHLPRMVRMAGRLLRYERELDRTIPDLQARLAAVEQRGPATLTDAELVERMSTLEQLVEEVAFANVLAPLLLNAYGSLVSRRLVRRGIDPQEIDPTAGHPGLVDYDPTSHLHRLSEQAKDLTADERAELAGGDLHVLAGGADFLNRFGHVSDSGNDLTHVPWREDPARLAPLLLDPPQGRVAAPGPGVLDQVSGLDRALVKRAQRFRWERERVSYTYTRGYGLFRPTVLEIGRRLVHRGVVDAVEDVYLLTRQELEQTLLSAAPDDVGTLIVGRREDMARLVDVEMPEVIFGDEFAPAPPRDPQRTLRGTPSARGVATGPARVVRGIGEAGRVTPGDVVVIPYSDVGWTPMLARAAGVVAESGGLLSHSSIVAREFGIPCVVSVAGAMRIPDGARIRVDGSNGAVQWDEGESA